MNPRAPTQAASARRWPVSQPPQLRAVILLAGTVRPSMLLRGIQRSVLEMPIEQDRSLMDLWAQQCERLARHLNQSALPVRVMMNQSTPELQQMPRADGAVSIGLEQDAAEYRGTGGTVRDAVAEYDDQDYVLITGGGQLLVEPLDELVGELAADGSDISLLSHGDGKPAALVLARCGCLRELASVGFLDLKEQVMPQLAQSHRVGVVERPTAAALPIRTREDYLGALRWYHRQHAGAAQASLGNPFAEDWQRSFAIVESGAKLADGVCVHDSVVLAGAEVADGATIVRSVVGPGARVERNARVLDELVFGAQQQEKERA